MSQTTETRSKGTTTPSTSLLRGLLACGIASSLLYIASDVIASARYEGYSYVNQAFSELLAIGSPVRPLVIPLACAYNVLVLAFAVGVWRAAGARRSMRAIAILLFAYGLTSLAGPFVPMHERGTAFTLTDVLHITCTAGLVVSVVVAMGFGTAALGRGFRAFSLAMIGVLVSFGALAGAQASRIAAGLPTPYVGIIERGNVYGMMLWVLVLAVALLRQNNAEATRRTIAVPAYPTSLHSMPMRGSVR